MIDFPKEVWSLSGLELVEKQVGIRLTAGSVLQREEDFCNRIRASRRVSQIAYRGMVKSLTEV